MSLVSFWELSLPNYLTKLKISTETSEVDRSKKKRKDEGENHAEKLETKRFRICETV